MKRLLAIALILVAALAACGAPDRALTPTADEAGMARGRDVSTATAPKVTSTSTDEPTAMAPNKSATRTLDGYGLIALDVDESGIPSIHAVGTVNLTPVERTPIPTPTTDPAPTATTVPATVTPDDPTPTSHPQLPQVPEVTSCEQVADLLIERYQLWFDALADVPEEVFDEVVWEGHVELAPPVFQQFNAQWGVQMKEIQQQADALGCGTDELTELFFDRIDRLVANNPNAERLLEILQEIATDQTPTPPSFSYQVEWTVMTCEDAADVFIERTQVLLLDAIAGMSMAEFEAVQYEELPESIHRFIYEFEVIHREFLAIGCTKDEVTVLIGERLDLLVPQGEAAEEVVATLREAVSTNDLFDDLG